MVRTEGVELPNLTSPLLTPLGVNLSHIVVTSTKVVGSNGLENFKRKVSDPRRREKLLNRWATDYFRSINARHRMLSLGGGRWPGLAESTKERKAKRGGHPGILRDTNQLLGATRPSGYGQLRRIDTGTFSLIVGISDVPYTHPHKRNKNPRTLGQLARFHAHGRGGKNSMPSRPIIVTPSPKLKEKMRQVALVLWLKQR